MNLACLACHVLDGSPERTLRSYSDHEGRCMSMGCFQTRKIPVTSPSLVAQDLEIADASRAARQQQVAPIPGPAALADQQDENAPSSPRLTRCHAVRRDLFRDWNFDEMSRQLCINLGTTA